MLNKPRQDTWAQIFQRESPENPPLIFPDNISLKKIGSQYPNLKEEIQKEFLKTQEQLGIKMSLTDFLKCVWCDNKKETEHTILYADKYEKNRAEAIK